MTISELAKLTTPEDRKLTAEIHKCDISYVNKILRGVRTNSAIEETLKMIVNEREKLKESLIQRKQNEQVV